MFGWKIEKIGMRYEYTEIPEDMIELVEEWREKLIEAVCEQDDDLLERFFEDRASITVEEFMDTYAQGLYQSQDCTGIVRSCI